LAVTEGIFSMDGDSAPLAAIHAAAQAAGALLPKALPKVTTSSSGRTACAAQLPRPSSPTTPTPWAGAP
jgi:8-amino-7-oxononanoate synthase